MTNFEYWEVNEKTGTRTYTAPNNSVITVDRSGITADGNLRNFNSAVKRELIDVLKDALSFYKDQQSTESASPAAKKATRGQIKPPEPAHTDETDMPLKTD